MNPRPLPYQGSALPLSHTSAQKNHRFRHQKTTEFKDKLHEKNSSQFTLQILKWSGKRGSNPPPLPWQGSALPNELFPHCALALCRSPWCFVLSSARSYILTQESDYVKHPVRIFLHFFGFHALWVSKKPVLQGFLLLRILYSAAGSASVPSVISSHTTTQRCSLVPAERSKSP